MLNRCIGRPLAVVAAALIWLWASSLASLAQPAEIDDGNDVQSSFAELDRYGKWIQHPEWGTVWSPDVDDDWRPYTVGRWVNTEEHGWYWDSEEPFGWAVYHYGRWLDDEEEGWIWVPGTEWGPAWVAWRYGDDAIGWAPLSPRAVWDPARGMLIDDEFYHGPRFAPFWIFVAPRHLLSPGLHRYAYPHARSAGFFARTRPATRYGWDNRRIFNHGIGIREIERLTRSPVASVRLLPSSRPGLNSRRAPGGAVYAYRPAIVPSDRWRSGNSGDWRRFEPGRPQAARQERGFAPPRNEFGRGDGPGDTTRRPFGDNRFPRDAGRGDSGRGERSAPSATVPGFQAPGSDRMRRDMDRSGDQAREPTRESPRDTHRRFDRDETRGRPTAAPAPSNNQQPGAPRGERWRDDGRRGDGNPRSSDGNRFREAPASGGDRGSAGRSAPPTVPRAQVAPPPSRPVPTQIAPTQTVPHRQPPPKKPDEAAPAQGPAPGSQGARRG